MARRTYSEVGVHIGHSREKWSEQYLGGFISQSPGYQTASIAAVFSESERAALFFDYLAMHQLCSRLMHDLLYLSPDTYMRHMKEPDHRLAFLLIGDLMGNEIRVMVLSGQSAQDHASNGEVFEPISRIMNAHVESDGETVVRRMRKEIM